MSISPVYTRLVRDALACLYDPIQLQKHPLQDWLDLAPEQGESLGEALRRTLWETVEELRPAASISVTRPEWLDYRLLWMHYVQANTQTETCRELGIGERTFYRRQVEAIAAVASLLWQRHRRKLVPSDSVRPPAPDAPEEWQDPARREAIRVAREARTQAVELSKLVTSAMETIEPLAKQRGIGLAVRAPERLPGIQGDPAMLRQIVLNVLTEGLDLALGDKIELSVDLVADEVLCQLGSLQSRALERDLAKAGPLSVSEGLLRVYGGRLWHEPDPKCAGASLLCFALPLGAYASVLIIDDDESTVDLYRRYLERRRYVVRGVREMAQLEALVGQGRPDIIILDVLMPQQDGWHFLQWLKQSPDTAGVPVLICSVLDQPSLALALGASAVLQKPISEAALLTAVEQALAQVDSSRPQPL